LAATALAYAWISRRFPPRGRQSLYFWAGLVVLAGALLSPLDAGAEFLFTLHMLQHMLLLLVAPPLMALAVPPALLGWMYGRPTLRRLLRALWAPIPAFLVFNGALLVWHLPAAYDAALRSPWIHAVEHLSFVATGLVFWGVIVSPAPIFVRAPLGLRLAMLIGADIVNFILGFTLAFAGRPFYAPYTAVNRLWGLAPLDDLRLGGAVMWVMGQMMYAVPVLILINVILWRNGGRGMPGRPSGPRPRLVSPGL
jgi:cytochrome c oxidase assembly factor CtaG